MFGVENQKMAAKKNRTRVKTLAHGRPVRAKSATSLSSKATRELIQTHHLLQKRKSKALSEGNEEAAAKFQEDIQAYGGIKLYQRASLLGQAAARGGDSSKVLMEWLKHLIPYLKARKGKAPLRLLEVGALSTTNACARSGVFEIERIDLNSQAEGIKQQDFMERPLPKLQEEKFEIISLSLVLNYVAEPVSRGEMLKHCLKFLRRPVGEERRELEAYFPALFLVLPAPCVTNSRYLDEAKLEAIMRSLGYEIVQRKLSNKLVYYLWRATEASPELKPETFKKIEVRSGKTRNNFAIVLK